MNRRTLMPIFAHPDDESFAGTGALIKYARAGSRVVLVCATLGEEGKAGDPPVCSREELPRVRKQELRAACAVLGVQELRLLGYRDKQLPAADEEEAVGRIVAAIRAYRPQVLYTFPPDGISGHPDHIAINRLARLAFRTAGDAGRYPDAGPAWQPDRLFWVLHHETADALADTVVETPGVVEARVTALKCHRTQHLSIDRVFKGFDPEYIEMRFARDHFQLAEVSGARPSGRLTDLFDGVR